jgi:L-asparaginase II
MGVLPCRKYPQGVGIAFKIEDGSDRAAQTHKFLKTKAEAEASHRIADRS